MAIINCPECGKRISDKAKNCPQCGYPVASQQRTTRVPLQNIRTSKPGSKTLLITIISILVVAAIAICCWMIITNNLDERRSERKYRVDDENQSQSYNNETNATNPYNVAADPHNLDEHTAIEIITGYLNAVKTGNAGQYFEEEDINFFDQKHLDKKEVLKLLENVDKTKSKHEFDWKTLKITPLSGGEYRVTFISNYYIFYESRTDKYKLSSEFILSPNLKIRSIKDLNTTKLESIPNPE